MRLLIGFDDHDSPAGGCTTHFTTLFIKSVLTGELRAKIVGLPKLVRLNPAIPWKTRGNAATAIELEHEDPREVFEHVESLTEEYDKEISKGTKHGRKPGAVIIEKRSEYINLLNRVYKKALTDVITFDIAEKVLRRINALYLKTRGSIGSLAALGFLPEEGFTYELLIYRRLDKERPRNIDFIRELEESYFPKIFYNYDFQKRSVIAEPRGNDPVLLGIRGVEMKTLIERVYPIIREKLKDYMTESMLFVTNQHTGAHILNNEIKIYRSIITKGEVINKNILQGGDVKIMLNVDGIGSVTVFVFRETGILAKVTQMLEKGDFISVEGVIKPSTTFGYIIEADAIEIVSLNSVRLTNPKCPKCGGSTESLGNMKGFRCKKCGFRFVGSKVALERERHLTLGKVISSRPRHLTAFPYVSLPKGTNEGDFTDLLSRLVMAL